MSLRPLHPDPDSGRRQAGPTSGTEHSMSIPSAPTRHPAHKDAWLRFLATRPGFVMLLAAAAALPQPPCRAQSLTALVAQRLTLVPAPARTPYYNFAWLLGPGEGSAGASAPGRASIEESLRRMRREPQVAPVVTPASPEQRATLAREWLDLRGKPEDLATLADLRAGFAEQHPDLQDGETGERNAISLIHYRLPWLVTPESADHALPTVTLRASDAVRFDLMGGVIGGRSGAYGQVVLRF